MNYDAMINWAGVNANLVLVTPFGDLFMTDAELKESGAVFSTRGSPLNREANLLLDFARHFCVDAYMEREPNLRGL